MRSRNDKNSCIGSRILGAIDLAIDFATLGEYGLEPLPATAGDLAGGPVRERPGPRAGWEPFARARRGDCGEGERPAATSRLRQPR